MHPTREAAQAIRNGAIDACAALDAALVNALNHLPAADRAPLRRAVAQVMGAIVLDLLNPAIAAYPDLEVGDAEWAEIALSRAATRALPR